MKKQKQKALVPVTKQPNPLVTNVKPNFEADAGVGQEGMTSQDYSIPRLVILQSGSPQVKKSDEAYVKGAEEGDIFDKVNSRIFKTEGAGIKLIPVSYRRTHLEWQPRDKGGGFVADHGPESEIMSKTAKDPKTGANLLANGNQISVVAEYFVFLVDKDGHHPYVISMTGSQMKKARQWNTVMNSLKVPREGGQGTFTPAMFYRSYDFTTVPESNAKGSWYGWKIVPAEDMTKLSNGMEIYQAARDFRAQVNTGIVKAAAPVAEHHQESDDAPM